MVTEKILNNNVRKLNNTELSNVSGGGLSTETKRAMMLSGDITMATGLVGSTFCMIASMIYKQKGNKAMRNAKTKEDIVKAEKCFDTAANLSIADGILFGLCVTGTAVWVGGRWG